MSAILAFVERRVFNRSKPAHLQPGGPFVQRGNVAHQPRFQCNGCAAGKERIMPMPCDGSNRDMHGQVCTAQRRSEHMMSLRQT